MSETIELRAFMGLTDVFRQRGWDNPTTIDVPGETSGPKLLALLELPREAVEVVFVNGKAASPEAAVVRGGDRVALAPPGVPGPYRVLLGFRKMG
ncbi:MoaD/ThiS family protein [Solidesulfovibrio sp.]|uniref:MoaD/ThiS family protein n=1 Tax=Solidesulfovibrio sp. TaxID=2910990 RepID=UPI0026135B51|nr:MoaD/ThiS family protein [Solidesulfovibrio sp.]